MRGVPLRVCLLRLILSHQPARSIRGRDEIGFIESYDSIWQKSSMTERDKRVTIKSGIARDAYTIPIDPGETTNLFFSGCQRMQSVQ